VTNPEQKLCENERGPVDNQSNRKDKRKMKRIGIVALFIVAMAACTAASPATSMAALPEFKVAKFPVAFKAEGEMAIFHSGLVNVKCKNTLTTGKVNANKLMTADVIYTGCALEGSPTDACTTPGAGKGALITNELGGEPVYLEGAGTEPGIIMGPNGVVKAITEFTCEGTVFGTVKLEGCIAAEWDPINKLVAVGELLFLENATHNGPKWTDKGNCNLKVTALMVSHAAWLTVHEKTSFAEDVELKA
jgi:hypothetical protein